jgi:hypothetical protein
MGVGFLLLKRLVGAVWRWLLKENVKATDNLA